MRRRKSLILRCMPMIAAVVGAIGAVVAFLAGAHFGQTQERAGRPLFPTAAAKAKP